MSYTLLRNIKLKELICAWRESELICAWWVAVVNCALQKAFSQNGISHLYATENEGGSSLPSTALFRSAKEQSFLIKNIPSLRCDQYQLLRREIKEIP